MANILVVDDEVDILMLIKNALYKDKHLVTIVSEPTEVGKMDLGSFDLILLDVMMPIMDGFTLCGQIRHAVDCPILFLTAKSLEEDVMYGLGLGADDYLIKPFGIGELRARVNAHIRRESREKRNILYSDKVHFNLSGKELFVQNERILLTKSEYEICEFLARHRGQVFSKEQIYESIFGFDGKSDSTAITEHVKNIRSKLHAFDIDVIDTVWGIGYKWR
ncbi:MULTISPECIES: response regulator transcription factor [Lysinibacillus]|jgi:DNA-binding response OmpR family regulator|uniref:response regulator transcription factor n=1 Tax=Lysinibacillus TaxID=400634 RepID=UPI000561B314|nr:MULTISPECIES: response regulator transcription factor [Lysinibacillus]MEE3807110.1 response regulator transcription factor [Lysinibacillus fusiformis]WCH48860.1 response regulator transcription factor [Lysinibacillus sp. OF-1]SCX87403.1 DNA-binding response regulator, OmpR family, contains REC and winged-helix (wHTH) domain [Lysinibacillus sp. SG9]SDB05395.1 DNA-binding response regulator, OmpR family, contains REC and winged-helix (wHTH) domain [Lysinibacillus sp. TC-37]SFS35605.1 DNA-bind